MQDLKAGSLLCFICAADLVVHQTFNLKVMGSSLGSYCLHGQNKSAHPMVCKGVFDQLDEKTPFKH